MVLIDSSVWIEAARRNGDLMCKVALEALLENAEATLCSAAKLEVLGGARDEERKKLSLHFSIMPYAAIAERHWDAAVRAAWRLRDRGHTIPHGDILIGALSLEHNCRVFARDKHFDTMGEVLGVQLYHPGYGGTFRPEEEEEG